MIDTLWPLLGWCLAVAASACIAYAGFGRVIANRRRRFRRCPKCWYDLSRTDGRQCPECGRTWKREAALYTVRRRRLMLLLGVVLAIGARFACRAAVVRAHGWAAALPDVVLIIAGPVTLPELEAHHGRRHPGPPWPTVTAWWSAMRRDVAHEQERRHDAHDFAPWETWLQAELLLRTTSPPNPPRGARCEMMESMFERGDLSAAQRRRLDQMFTVELTPARDCWPPGTTMLGVLEISRWIETGPLRITIRDATTGDQFDRFDTITDGVRFARISYVDQFRDWRGVRLGPARAGIQTAHVTIEIERLGADGAWESSWHGDRSITIAGHGTRDDHVRVRPAPRVDHALRAMQPQVPHEQITERGVAGVHFNGSAVEAELTARGIDAVACRYELRQGHDVIAYGASCALIDDVIVIEQPHLGFPDQDAYADYMTFPGSRGFGVRLHPVAPLDQRPEAAPLTLRIVSDPDLALFGDDLTYWSGDVEIPVTLLPPDDERDP